MQIFMLAYLVLSARLTASWASFPLLWFHILNNYYIQHIIKQSLIWKAL